MYVKLFSKWTPEYLLSKIRDSDEEVFGRVEGVQAIFGLHQVNYSYSLNGKKMVGFDTIPSSRIGTLHNGDEILVNYSRSEPRLSMIRFGEQADGCNQIQR